MRTSRWQSAKLEAVIIVEHIIGKGVEGDPVRRITTVLKPNGDFIAEHDPSERIES